MAKNTIMHEGKRYYSVSTVAKLLSTTPGKVRELINHEGFEWSNFRANGPIWVGADAVDVYLRRKPKKLSQGEK